MAESQYRPSRFLTHNVLPSVPFGFLHFSYTRTRERAIKALLEPDATEPT